MKRTILLTNLFLISLTIFSQEIRFKTDKGDMLFPDDFMKNGPELNQPFPDFQFVDILGDSIKLTDFADKTLVINVWFVGCTGCKHEEANLRKITESYKTNDQFAFVSFCMTNENKIHKYFDRHGEFGYRTISVDRDEMKERYNTITSPTHFIVDKGILVTKFTMPIYEGQIMDWYVEQLEAVNREL